MSVEKALRFLAIATVGGILIGAAGALLAVLAYPVVCQGGQMFLHWMMQGAG